MGIRNILILIFSFGSIFLSFGQESQNPFDLPSRLQDERINRDTTSNPFEIVPKKGVQSIADEQNSISTITTGFEIGIGVVLIILLALLLTLFRGVFNDFVESAYRDRKFNQFFRRMKSMWNLPNILFYLYFCIILGVYVFLSLTYFNGEASSSPLQTIGIITGCIGAYFLFKHLILSFLGSTFDVSNEANRYSLLIMTFNIIVGIVLTPLVILLLLGPEQYQGSVIVLGTIVTAIMLGFFLLRALSVSNRLLVQHSFHFFMYLCTIEIAPLFIIAKMLI